MSKEFQYSVKDGYNIVAKYYDEWKWQNFWNLNELPILEKWGEMLPIGNGLDAGTGSGNNLNFFLTKGHKVTAIDNSHEMLNLCRNKYPEFITKGQLDCRELDIQNLHMYNNKFDWVTCNRVITHIDDVELVFNSFSDVLKKNGQCFISDIHPLHSYTSTGLTINNNKVFIKTFKHSIDSLKRTISKYNFEIIDFKEIGFKELDNKTLTSEFVDLSSQSSPIFFYFIIRLNSK